MPVETDGLGNGRYARMHVVLEKTIFDIDVLDLEIRVDQPTADALEAAVKGRKYSSTLERQVVNIAVGSADVYTALKFLRDFERDAFVAGIRLDLGRAYRGKLIDEDAYSRTYWALPTWFAFLGKRGVKKGDWLYDRGRPSGLRTVFVDRDGSKRIDIHVDGSAPVRTLLATYLAPGGDLREPLVRSLFDG